MHFTYSDKDFSSDLLQGDIIRRTPGIDGMLQEIHHHYYQHPENKYFIILTQDCDLVRRNGVKCDSPYISIAPVRPMKVVLDRHIQQFIAEGFSPELPVGTHQNEARFRNFLERLLNNNESNYFFLRREPTKQFPEDCCAFLALSIAVKAPLHYNTIREAKILELQNSFRYKLGWLVGQMYSRVGTDDWPKEALKKETKEIVKQVSIWTDQRKVRDLLIAVDKWKSTNPDVPMTRQTLSNLVEKMPKRKEQVVQHVVSVLESNGIITQANKARVTNIIRNDPFIATLITD